MSITPLDLQTLFVRLNEVGKEQNQLKEAVASQQAAGAKEIKDAELQQDHSVNKTEEDKESQKLRDDEKKDHQGKNESDQTKEQEQVSNSKKIFKDPEVGTVIDISG